MNRIRARMFSWQFWVIKKVLTVFRISDIVVSTSDSPTVFDTGNVTIPQLLTRLYNLLMLLHITSRLYKCHSYFALYYIILFALLPKVSKT